MAARLPHVTQKVYANEGNEDVYKRLHQLHPDRVLDIGCGDGSLARRYKTENVYYIGITLSEAERELAQKACTEVFIHNLEAGLPERVLSMKFDAIVCSHVLEHICQPDKLLQDCKHVLSDQGVLLTAIPNMFHITSRIKILLGRFKYEHAGLWDNTHYRWYNYQIMSQTLNGAGYEITHFFATGDIPWLCRIPGFKATKFYSGLNQIILKTFPSLMGYQFIFTCRVK